MHYVVGRAGFEPATFRLSVERSSRAELPAPAVQRTKFNGMLVNKNLVNSTVFENSFYSNAKMRSSSTGISFSGDIIRKFPFLRSISSEEKEELIFVNP
jgi:hypothetical protein